MIGLIRKLYDVGGRLLSVCKDMKKDPQSRRIEIL